MLRIAFRALSPGEDAGAAARGLLLELLVSALGERRGGETFAALTKDENGRPFLAWDAPFVSFTHTKGLAAAAWSDSPVGIDAERLRPLTARDRALLRRFFAGERGSVYAARDQSGVAFFRFWTRREAAFKAFGTKPFYEEDPVPGHKTKTKTVEVNGDFYLLTVASDTDRLIFCP
ncbi:MAG: 4'-phosphopantetheinyl transferase superfamily protein [Clostridia bacterium]|nr:4'-phosphopantetheinyl transferase superfamily protein [Clostridia bacterium]